ncbi:MAG: hypothetical protein WAM82_16895 [Thermoanaerobaculia bacterium]
MAGSPHSDGVRFGFRALRRGLLLGSALGARVFFAAPATAQDPCAPPSGDTGFAEVSVNLNAGTFNRVLPFDVPVRVCGTAPAGTTSMAVQYVVSKKADISMDDTCRVLLPAGSRLQPEPAILGRLDGTTFRVILPPLMAERYYAFCFERRAKLPDDLAAKFKSQAREILDRRLAEVTSGDLSPQQSLKLRTELYSRLAAAANADDLALTESTVFDLKTGYDEMRSEGRVHGLVLKVLDPQRREARIVAGDPRGGLPALSERQLDFKGALQAVRASPALARLADQLGKNAQTDTTLQELLASRNFKAALALLHADDDQLSLVAQGRETGEAAPNLQDQDQAMGMASRYDDVSAALSGLAGLIRKVADSPPASSLRAGLSAEDLTALRALADPAGPLTKAANLAFTLSGLAQDLETALAERSTAISALAEVVRVEASQVEVVDGSTTGNFATAQNNYTSADAGILFAPQLSKGLSYVGMNFYFRPVNKDADLSQFGSFSRRFAMTLGLTVESVADGGGGTLQTRKDLFGNQSLVLGGGLRVTSSFRAAAGAVIFQKKDRDPLVSKYSTGATYYFSLSFDLNVAKAFQGGFGSLFGG